jgi:hypothetical protein
METFEVIKLTNPREAARHGPSRIEGHFQPRPPDHLLPLETSILPERTAREMNIVRLSPEEGLAPLEEEIRVKSGESLRPGESSELVDRLRDLQNERPELLADIQRAFDDLQSDGPRLNSLDYFCGSFYHGLELSLANPKLAELDIAQKLERLLPTEPERIAECRKNIELLARLGRISLHHRLEAERACRFLETFLANISDQEETIRALEGAESNIIGRGCFTAAVELIDRLYSRELERIESAADQERAVQLSVFKHLAERKDKEKQERTRYEKQLAEHARAIKLTELISLGRALLSSQAEAEQAEGIRLPAEDFIRSVVEGVDKLGWLSRVLDQASNLTVETEAAAEFFSLAYRWARLDARLAGMPLLSSHIRDGFLNAFDNAEDSLRVDLFTREALKLFNHEQTRIQIAAGFALLISEDKSPNLAAMSHAIPMNGLPPLPTLKIMGSIVLSLQEAVNTQDDGAFVRILKFCARDKIVPITGNLDNQQESAFIGKALVAAGPAAVPLIMSAYRSVGSKRQLDKRARQTIRDVVAQAVTQLCLKYYAVLSNLLEADQAVRPRQAEAAPEEVIELRSRPARLPNIRTQILDYLFGFYAQAKLADHAIENIELRSQEVFTPEERLPLEVQRLISANPHVSSSGTGGTVADRINVLALAVQTVNMLELTESGPQIEALDRLLESAAAAGLKLADARALVGFVYAGPWEKGKESDLRELSAFCGGEAGGTISTVNMQRVLGVIGKRLSLTFERDVLEADEITLAAETLLVGLVMRRDEVKIRPTRAARIISVLQGNPEAWDILRELVKTRPAEAAAFIDGLIEKAGKAIELPTQAGTLTLVKNQFDVPVLETALQQSLPKLRSLFG